MPEEAWVTLGIFAALQAIAFGGLVFSMKGDTNMLKSQMADVQTTLRELGTVLVSMAETRGRIDRLDDRLLSQGKRLDDLSRRLDDNHDRN
jgi:hypothetical protein